MTTAFTLPATTTAGRDRTTTTRHYDFAEPVEFTVPEIWTEPRWYRATSGEITYARDTGSDDCFGWAVQEVSLAVRNLLGPGGAEHGEPTRMSWYPGTKMWEEQARWVPVALVERYPKPEPLVRLDVVVDRHPDSETYTTVFADGLKLTEGPGLEIHNIDPGAGGAGCGWLAEMREHGDRVPRAVREFIDYEAAEYHRSIEYCDGSTCDLGSEDKL